MMTKNDSLDCILNMPKVKALGLDKKSLADILKAYNRVVLQELLENGHIELGNGMVIEIIQLVDRVHVLRGNTYKSSRKYKLKLTMEEKLYTLIEGYYNKLKEEIS